MVFAIAAMYMVGQPWRFRDYLFKSAENQPFGSKLAGLVTVALVIMFIPFAIAYV